MVRRNAIPRTTAMCLLTLTTSIWAGVNYEEPPIQYSNSNPENVVSRLQEKFASEDSRLEWEPRHGYLTSLLRKLDISVTSQVLAFSKTSVQDDKIGPKTPRAIYFNDEVHVGYVQHGSLEIAAADPLLGVVFYTLEQNPEISPSFQRRTNNCLTCHGAARTKNVPGLLIRSVFPDPEGQPVIAAGSYLTTHLSPLSGAGEGGTFPARTATNLTWETSRSLSEKSQSRLRTLKDRMFVNCRSILM